MLFYHVFFNFLKILGLYLSIAVVIAKIFISAAKLMIPIGMLASKAKVEIEKIW